MIHKEKYFLGGLIAVMMALGLTACDVQPAAAGFENSTSLQTKIITVYEAVDYSIVYNAANRVMYSVVNHNRGAAGVFTLLVDENGSPMIWKG